MNKHLLSICIPTNGISRWVIPTLNNIYSLNTDHSLFEVVVADNGGSSSDLADKLDHFKEYNNFHYYKTDASGFYNIIENFSLAKGDYMIKLNHRCILHPGMIEYIIDLAEKYYEEKPLMFFSNGNVKLGRIQEYSTFDSFMYDFSFWSSLSEGLFFWREDLLRIPEIKFAKMSPNVSLMFDSRVKSKFVLIDTVICHDQDAKGKFGYDLFDTFAVLYLDLVNQQRIDGFLSKKTFIKIKNDILKHLGSIYMSILYYNEFENYSLDNMKESIGVYYTEDESDRLVSRIHWIEHPKSVIKHCIKKILKR